MIILRLSISALLIALLAQVQSIPILDAQGESVTVSTDKTTYHYGDNYTISGKVNPVVPNVVVSILILSSDYPHPASVSLVPNSDGSYLYTLPLKFNDVLAGNFTVIAQYAGAKNQTTFSYIGLPCNQLNNPGNISSAPIIRGPPASNPRIIDSFGNAITGPVKVGQQIQITYDLANGLNCAQPFAYIVQIQDHNGITVSLSWITGTLLAGKFLNPAQSWIPQYNDTYTAQIFTWQSLDNPNALAPPVSVSFDVEPNLNFTESSPIQKVSSTCNAGFIHLIKKEDNSPACVKPDTAQKLIERGWARQEGVSIPTPPIQGQTTSGNATLPASFMPCDTPYPQNGPGVAVLYMPMNSTGKICVQYSNSNPPQPVGVRTFEAQRLSQDTQEITATADHDTIPTGNSVVVYTIKTTNHAGFYGFTIFCVGMPLAVGYDNNSTIAEGDFPWLGQTFHCPAQLYDYHIVGLTGIGVKHIP